MDSPITHEYLWQIVKKLPEDYTPYGTIDRDDYDLMGHDCASGCRWYAKLVQPLGNDWGVCTNQKSHRCGVLTFEHQGCLEFEPE